MARVLFFGGTGMLAAALVPRLSLAGHTVVPLGSADVQLTDPASAGRIVRCYRPDIVINAAGNTDVDGCEFAPDRAMAVNARGAGKIAAAAAEIGAPLLHISTDYVFEGTATSPYREEDPTRPLSRYGKSKLAGERAVMASGGEWTIVRTSWLFGPGGKSFPLTILRIAEQGGDLRVVNDQTGTPTYTIDLADALAICLERGARGIYHVANSGVATWHDVAVEVVRSAGLANRVIPVTTAEFPRPAHRPAYSALSTEKAARDLGINLPDWRSGVSRFVHDHLARGVS